MDKKIHDYEQEIHKLKLELQKKEILLKSTLECVNELREDLRVSEKVRDSALDFNIRYCKEIDILKEHCNWQPRWEVRINGEMTRLLSCQNSDHLTEQTPHEGYYKLPPIFENEDECRKYAKKTGKIPTLKTVQKLINKENKKFEHELISEILSQPRHASDT